MHCAQCGVLNAPSANFCSACGTSVAKDSAGRAEPSLGSESAWQAVSSDSRQTMPKTAEHLRELYALTIGDKNQDHYLQKFEQFDRDGKTSVGWHWPAFFVTFYWLLYRKMWGKAAIYFFLPYLVVTVVVGIASAFGSSAVVVAYGAYVVGLFALPALFADGIYYSVCKKRIKAALAANGTQQGQRILITQKGGTSNIALIIVCVLGLFFFVGILAAVAIPAYQDYTVRAKAVQALSYGKSAGVAVGEFYSEKRRLPASLAEASFTQPLPTGLQDIQLNKANGVLSLVLAPSPVTGRAIQLVPSVDTDGRVLWKCEAANVAPKYLPQECRQ